MMERFGSSIAQGGAEASMPGPAGGAMQPPSAGGEEQPNVTPEEQAAYEQFVVNAFQVLYTDQGGKPAVAPQVTQALKASDDPIANLATAAVSVVTSLRDSAKKAGSPIPDDILFHGAVAVVEELAGIAEATGIHDYSEEDQEFALYRGLDMYRSAGEQTGDVDKQALSEEWGQIVAADQQGRLGEVLPGIESRMKEAG